jgi:hypothetical protein
MPESKTILAFDIGIRNLAWCLLQTESGPETNAKILGWQNYDLLTGQSAEGKPKKTPCVRCASAATFQNPVDSGGTCLRHCPSSHPPFKDISGNTPFRKIPDMKTLRRCAPTVRASNKLGFISELQKSFSLPIVAVKMRKALEVELTTIHDAIRTFVAGNLELFRQATHILLENQPVLKNPTMKSVQILLFATLRDMLQPGPPPLKLVHAGKKVQGLETGDAGYASRKDASEAKVAQTLEKGKVLDGAAWLARFTAQSKKSDLADAFCMCWDAKA